VQVFNYFVIVRVEIVGSSCLPVALFIGAHMNTNNDLGFPTMQKYTPKPAKKPPSLKLVKGSDDPGKLGNLECRRHVYAYLVNKNRKPVSTKDTDLVPMLEDFIDHVPADLDDTSDVYVWMVLTLVDRGELQLPSLALRAWNTQPRVRLVRAFMNEIKTATDEEED
jgi:hypothetical protein